MAPIRRHAVCRSDCSECDSLLVGALIAHDAHGLDGKEDGACLPNLIVETGIAKALNPNVVNVLEDANLFGRDVPEDADREAGPGEWVAAEEISPNAEGLADAADLIFEEEAKGFDDVEFHEVGQAAHIVVAFDGGRGAAGC